MFKQRYNVAVRRAKDQVWLVHSLDAGRDLQPHDLRRRLIGHVRDPGVIRRAQAAALRRAESPFEAAGMQRLISAGYRVEPQVEVGRYRIDGDLRWPVAAWLSSATVTASTQQSRFLRTSLDRLSWSARGGDLSGCAARASTAIQRTAWIGFSKNYDAWGYLPLALSRRRTSPESAVAFAMR